MEKNLTTGSVLKSILYFSLPYLLSYFLQTLYGMADLFIIGQFEDISSITAVSIGSQVMHMITVMIVGLAMGATVNIGQAIGAGNKKKAAKDIGNTVTLFMMLAIVGAAGLLFFIKPIVGMMSTPQEAVHETVIYLTICFLGIPFITAYNIISSIFRGIGDSKSPMYFIAVACASNIALDYLFMGALHLGPAGAALGTTLSQLVSVIISLVVILRRKSGIHLSGADFKLERSALGEILSIGIPVMMQDGFIQVSFMIITIIANHRGLTDAAAVGIVEKIISFLFLVPSSMLSTVSALGAQNIGAGKHDRVKQGFHCGMRIEAAYGVLIAVVCFSGAPFIMKLFVTDPEVVHLGVRFLRTVSLFYLMPAFTNGIQGFFRGIGDLKVTLVSSTFNMVFRVAAAAVFVLVWKMEIEALPYSYAVGWVVMLLYELPMLVRYLRSHGEEL